MLRDGSLGVMNRPRVLWNAVVTCKGLEPLELQLQFHNNRM
jgi:hypothetical protein